MPKYITVKVFKNKDKEKYLDRKQQEKNNTLPVV
jgi:hypothetical protein